MDQILLNADTIEGFVKAFLIDRYHERRPTPQCHRDWWRMVTSNARKVALAAPRGHGKSTALNHAYGLCAALFKQHPFQIKVSKTYDLACEKIEQAKQELIDNEKIKHVFRLKKIIRDRENDFIAEMSDGYKFRMRALGMGQATRGLAWGTMRPTLIIGDDMEDDEEVLSKDRREKGMRWIMNTLLPMGGERTDVRFFGTILHNDSCLVKLLNMPSFKTGIWQACDETLSDKSILWPEKFTPDRLLATKQEYISAGNLAGFNMEYRNIARDTTSGYFRPEDLRPMGEGDGANLTYYVGMDFAISESERSDYTVMVVAGLDDTGMLFVVDVVRLRTEDGNKIIDEMFVIENAYHPAEWFLEEGAIRKGLGAALELRQREEGEAGTYLNMRMFVPTKEKTIRARNIQARIRARAVKFRTEAGWFEEFKDELEQFPRGKHDDQCFAGDTMILMAEGHQKRIDRIAVGEWVMTPYGPAPVEAAGMTNPCSEVYWHPDTDLVATADHPVWNDAKKRWKSFAKLNEGDTILHVSASINGESSCQESTRKKHFLRKSSSTDRLIVATRTPSDRICAAISRAVAATASCIETFGVSTMDRYQRAATSIMKMAIFLTTPSATCVAFQGNSTSPSICQNYLPTVPAKNSTSTLRKFANRLLLGIALRLAVRGTASMEKILGGIVRFINLLASSVQRRLNLRSSAQDFAASRASTSIGVAAMSVTSPPRLLLERIPVYNLTIGGAHCYFANGVLVHNCDALAYIGLGLADMVTPLSAEEEEEVEREFLIKETMSFGRSAVTGY